MIQDQSQFWQQAQPLPLIVPLPASAEPSPAEAKALPAAGEGIPPVVSREPPEDYLWLSLL